MARYDAHARCVSPNLRGSHPPASVRRLATTRFAHSSNATFREGAGRVSQRRPALVSTATDGNSKTHSKLLGVHRNGHFPVVDVRTVSAGLVATRGAAPDKRLAPS